MTRGEIRQAIRDNLGEPSDGFWTDTELNRWIQDACNQHARECLSVQRTKRTSTIGEVQEYELPDDVGEIKAVWFLSNDTYYELYLVSKSAILDGYLPGSDISNLPTCYYHDSKLIGLYPVPDSAPTESYADEDSADASEEFINATYNLGQSFTLDSETQVHNIGLYLRKNGAPSGTISVAIYSDSSGVPGASPVSNGTSQTLDIEADLEGWWQWVNFNLPTPPVLSAGTYWLVPQLDATYQAGYVSGETSVLWASDQTSSEYSDGYAARYSGGAWTADSTTDFLFEVHPLRNDLWIDYHASKVADLASDSDEPEVPNRYHQDIVNLVTARAFRKDGYDLQLAAYYDKLAMAGTTGSGGMMKAKANVLRGARSRRSRTRTGYYHREGSIIINNP